MNRKRTRSKRAGVAKDLASLANLIRRSEAQKAAEDAKAKASLARAKSPSDWRYEHSEKGRARRDRYNHSAKGLARYRRYHAKPEVREADKWWHRSARTRDRIRENRI